MGLKLSRQRDVPGCRAAFAVACGLWERWLFCFLLTAGASVFASSPPLPPATAGGKGHRTPSGNVLPTVAPESAVVFDDSYHPPAKDLLLTLEGERKAEAAAHFMDGLLLEDMGNVDDPSAEYLKSLALDPANVELSVSIAQDYLRKGDMCPAAINLLKDTIKAAPKAGRARTRAGLHAYFTSQNKPDLALKAATQALELDPGNIEAYIYLRIILRPRTSRRKIAPLLERATKADTKDPEFWLQLGKLYIQTVYR